MNKLIVTSLLVVVTGFSFSQRKIDSKFGKGLYNVVAADSSWSMKFAIRFQSLFVAEWNVNDSTGFGQATTNSMIRRARLKFGGFAWSPKLKYKMELGLSNKDLGKVSDRTNFAPRMILDAVVKWNFYQNFELWAGQTKIPSNRERIVSSANLQFVDRSHLNKVFNLDRDIGLQLHHHFKLGKQFIIKEAFAFSQGEGRNLVQDNLGGYKYTGRIEFLPFGNFTSKGDYVGSDMKRESKPKLAITAVFDWHDRAVKDKASQGKYMSYDTNNDGDIDGYFQTNVNALFLDLMFKYKGFSFMGEYAMRDADQIQQSIINDDLSTTTRTVYVGDGFNAQAGYLFKNNWEIAGRYTQINPETITGKSAFQQYTLGVSRYIVGHKLKIQTDVSYLTTEGSANSGLMYRMQVDLHF